MPLSLWAEPRLALVQEVASSKHIREKHNLFPSTGHLSSCNTKVLIFKRAVADKSFGPTHDPGSALRTLRPFPRPLIHAHPQTPQKASGLESIRLQATPKLMGGKCAECQ